MPGLYRLDKLFTQFSLRVASRIDNCQRFPSILIEESFKSLTGKLQKCHFAQGKKLSIPYFIYLCVHTFINNVKMETLINNNLSIASIKLFKMKSGVMKGDDVT